MFILLTESYLFSISYIWLIELSFSTVEREGILSSVLSKCDGNYIPSHHGNIIPAQITTRPGVIEFENHCTNHPSRPEFH